MVETDAECCIKAFRRRLVHIPIVHTETDLGGLSRPVQRAGLRMLGTRAWRSKLKAIDAMWAEIERSIEQLGALLRKGPPLPGRAAGLRAGTGDRCRACEEGQPESSPPPAIDRKGCIPYGDRVRRIAHRGIRARQRGRQAAKRESCAASQGSSALWPGPGRSARRFFARKARQFYRRPNQQHLARRRNGDSFSGNASLVGQSSGGRH